MTTLTKTLLVLAALIAAAAAGAVAWASNSNGGLTTFQQEERHAASLLPGPTVPAAATVAVDPVDVPEPRAGITTYLVFGVGVPGLDAEEAAAIGVRGERGADLLTDSVMLLRVEETTGRVDVVSLPRDLWFSDLGAKLSEVYPLYGLETFTTTVEQLTGVKVDRRVRVAMPAFVELVDAAGGVELTTETALRDRGSGLELAAGTHRLDGVTALAYARSRKLEVPSPDGGWRFDASASDIGRTKRQQQLLTALAGELATPATVGRVGELYAAVRDNVVVDEDLTVSEAIRLARVLTGGEVTLDTATLPVIDGREGRKWVVYPTVDDVPGWFEARLSRSEQPDAPPQAR